jgi:hypothetical protein
MTRNVYGRVSFYIITKFQKSLQTFLVTSHYFNTRKGNKTKYVLYMYMQAYSGCVYNVEL